MTDARKSQGPSKLAIGGGVLLLSAALSWTSLHRLVTHAEGRLPLGLSVDVVVPLAGSPERFEYAESIYRQRAARSVMSTLVDPRCARDLSLSSPCLTRVRNTVDEAVVLRRIFQEEHVSSAVVVTSHHHLARAGAVFAVVFAGSEIMLHFVASPGVAATSTQVNREVAGYVPSVIGALLAREVPSLYEWGITVKAACQSWLDVSLG